MGIIRSGLQSLMNFPGSYVFLFLCLMTRDSISSTVGEAELKTSAKKSGAHDPAKAWWEDLFQTISQYQYTLISK